jgi:hypothetical protein
MSSGQVRLHNRTIFPPHFPRAAMNVRSQAARNLPCRRHAGPEIVEGQVDARYVVWETNLGR